MLSRDTPVNISVTTIGRDQFARFLAAEKRRAARTAEAYARRHGLAELEKARTAESRAQARVIKIVIRDKRRTRREAGRLFDTNDLAVTEAVRRELLARGYDLEVPPRNVPDETGRTLQGRPLGGSASYSTFKINALIPAVYVAGVALAAWETEGCREAWEALIAFDERYEYDGFPKSLPDDLSAERGRISARITTNGDVYRKALNRLD